MANTPFFEAGTEKKKQFDSLFSKIREYSEPPIWSQAVRLTRNAEFLVDDRNPKELQIRIIRRNEAVSPKVSLFLEDEDWSCDFDSLDDPCVNTIAAAISVNSGVGLSRSKEQPVSFIQYVLTVENNHLAIKRFVTKGDSRTELTQPLRELAGGAQSGRIKNFDLAVSKEDFAVEAALGSRKRGIIQTDRMLGVLKALSAFPEVLLNEKPITISSSLPKTVAEVYREGEFFYLGLQEPLAVERDYKNSACIIEGRLHPHPNAVLGERLASMILGEGKRFPRSRVLELKDEIVPALQRHLEVDESAARYPKVVSVKPYPELVMKREGSDLRVYARILYGNPPLAESDGRTLNVFAKGIHIERSMSDEKQIAVRLKQELHLQLGRELVYSGQEAVDFTKKSSTWNSSGKGFELAGKLQPKISYKDGLLATSFKTSSGGKADFRSTFEAWQNDEPYVALNDGTWAALPDEWFEKYGQQIASLIEAQEANKKLPAYLQVEVSEVLEQHGLSLSKDLREFKKRLHEASEHREAVVPDDLQATLRDYQKTGVAWLQFLKTAGIGALLADDMGLGKTLQVISVLEPGSLIVAPTSVLPSWKNQLAKFRPSLKVTMYHGSNRSLEDTSEGIVLTSYALMRNDIELLRERAWNLCVLDEAQNIKNPKSLVSQAAYSLAAKFKICMSGTPIENSLDDLWSQFHFLSPMLLGSREVFRKRFKRGISNGDAQASRLLKQKVAPFILRRLKSEVLKELPPKTEDILWTELPEAQRNVYDSIYAATKTEVLEKLDAKGGVFAALEALLRLRQACCHTDLLPGSEISSSEKVEVLLDSLRSSTENGHRALIFSQWTSFLDLVEPHLQKAGISFSRLDGTTTNREAVISDFQQDHGSQVMLLSLKAGGVGVTLTAADHIYLLDSWWNPAVEEQATDRAHRIGQENPVFVYRLIARNTIEENILKLQESKKSLAKVVLSESTVATSITKADIISLFDA